MVTAPVGGVDPALASAALGSAVARNEARICRSAAKTGRRDHSFRRGFIMCRGKRMSYCTV